MSVSLGHSSVTRASWEIVRIRRQRTMRMDLCKSKGAREMYPEASGSNLREAGQWRVRSLPCKGPRR